MKLKELAHAAENYHSVLAENRQLFNEVQELKGSVPWLCCVRLYKGPILTSFFTSLAGNIRVYCRTRPFLPKQTGKSCIEYIGDNGEIIISNPSKPGKDGQRMFKFNKVYDPAATQGYNLSFNMYIGCCMHNVLVKSNTTCTNKLYEYIYTI